MKFTTRVENPTKEQMQFAIDMFNAYGTDGFIKGGHISTERIDTYFDESYWEYVASLLALQGSNGNVQVFKGWPEN